MSFNESLTDNERHKRTVDEVNNEDSVIENDCKRQKLDDIVSTSTPQENKSVEEVCDTFPRDTISPELDIAQESSNQDKGSAEIDSPKKKGKFALLKM